MIIDNLLITYLSYYYNYRIYHNSQLAQTKQVMGEIVISDILKIENEPINRQANLKLK